MPQRPSQSFAPLAGLCAALALVSPGCATEDLSDGGTPALVLPTEQVLAELQAAKTAKTDPDQVEEDGELRLGAEDFATEKHVQAYVEWCEDYEPKELPKAGEGDDRSSGFGKIWQGTKPAPDYGPAPDKHLTWIEGGAEFLDPNRISESAGNAIASQMFEGLLNIAPGNSPPVPAQAERFEISEDGKTYTFYLRKGLQWSDGTPLTAHDFKYSWLRGLHPDTASKNAQQLWLWIKGAKAFNSGKSKAEDVAIRVVDDLTLEVELNAPTSFFPDLVTYVAYSPVPKHVVEKHGKQWTKPEHIVVNGAFTMTEWTPRDRIELKKNPTYWDADNVFLETSTILISDDEPKNVRFYETGQAHVSTPLPPDKVRRWLKEGRSDLRIDEMMCTYYYVFRTDRPPFNNRRVRQAFNMALDKERVARHVIGSFEVPARNLISSMFESTLGYKAVPGDDFDPTEAKRILAEAGYPGGADLPKAELIYNTYEKHRLIAEFAQRSLKDNLGVNVPLNNMEWKSLLKKVHAGDFTIARTSWCADYPDPMTFLEVFSSDSENNYPKYHNPAYDQLLAQIRDETDKRRRNVLICAAERVLNRDLPIMPIYFYTVSTLIRPFVKGYEPQYQDHHLLKYVRIEP